MKALRILFLAASIACWSSPTAAQTGQAESALQRALHALAALESLSYVAEWEWKDGERLRTSNPAGVQIVRNEADSILPLRIRIEYQSGTTVVWKDGVQRGVFPTSKRFIVEPRGAAGLISGGIYYIDTIEPNLAYSAQSTRLPRFERILSTAVSLHTDGPEEPIDGVMCEVIAFELPPNQFSIESHGRVWIGTRDSLPRKYHVKFRRENSELGHYMLTLKSVQIDPSVPPEAFELTGPEGYERIDEADRDPPPPMGPFLDVGDVAPGWELKTPDGNTLRLSDARGSLVLLDFWGTWCQPCLQAMPGIQGLHERFREKGLRVYGLSCFEKEGATPAAVMAELGFDYELLLNADGVAAAYGVTHYPTVLLLDREGVVIARYVGASEEKRAQLEATIADLVK